MEKTCVLLAIFALLGVCQATRIFYYEDYDVYEEYADKTCKKQGLMCKNCNTLVRCVEEGDGFTEYPVQTCNGTNKEYCLNDKECSTTFNPQCSSGGYNFTCQAVGMFPDPFNCQKYYICVKDTKGSYVKYPQECPAKYKYNMLTTYCDTQIPNGCSTNSDELPCPICKNAGQTGWLSENKSIWYLCTKHGDNVMPDLHLCPYGKWYDGNGCIDKNEWTTVAPPPTAPASD